MNFITNLTGTPVTGARSSDGTPSGSRNKGGVIGGPYSGTGFIYSTLEYHPFLATGSPRNPVSTGYSLAIQSGAYPYGSALPEYAPAMLATGVSGISSLATPAPDSAYTYTESWNTIQKLEAFRSGAWNEYSGTWNPSPVNTIEGGWNIASGAEGLPFLRTSGVDTSTTGTGTPAIYGYTMGGAISGFHQEPNNQPDLSPCGTCKHQWDDSLAAWIQITDDFDVTSICECTEPLRAGAYNGEIVQTDCE